MKCLRIYVLLSFFFLHSNAQHSNLIFIDKNGILRYTQTLTEANFFGVNYTIPFAYGYRSHKALGIDPEKAIDADVYHMSRLGMDAFRVHVWDVEISDSSGNLIENEHVRLFDYLLMKLKQYHIKILITPIAFWGNGYPEKDIRTNGFSYIYGKGGSVVKEAAFLAQENYLKQFFTHVNPYTKLTYKDDPDVIAMEINNEPHHSGPPKRTTEYINRMSAAVRSTGWNKPIFYNISESPNYAGAVVQAHVDGFSFQWYPTNLVANHERKGNYLTTVDRYHIPFRDSLALFQHKALMVYEFDAGDLSQSIMYPAMARSFRTAGFQWATQFAYDPMYTAHANTEYQTHYLNLAYTPAKAISLLIAGKAFHQLPLRKEYGVYPSDSSFGPFRVSYLQQLSEMNTDEEFYYSNNTSTIPKNTTKLKHIAGVGSSPIIQYKGSGAYFLDKLNDGSWRLEIMPNAIPVNDPFGRASVSRMVVNIEHRSTNMHIHLPEINDSYWIKGINKNNRINEKWNKKGNDLIPGVYLLSKSNENPSNASAEFYAPDGSKNTSMVDQPKSKSIGLLEPIIDKERLMIYNPDWKKTTLDYNDHSIKLNLNSNTLFGLQHYFGRPQHTSKSILIKARAEQPLTCTIGFIDVYGTAFSTQINLNTNWNEIEIPVDQFKKDSCLLLPRSYPGFQPLWFSSSRNNAFVPSEAEKIELRFHHTYAVPIQIELAYIRWKNELREL